VVSHKCDNFEVAQKLVLVVGVPLIGFFILF
jgi:hypothetical protein